MSTAATESTSMDPPKAKGKGRGRKPKVTKQTGEQMAEKEIIDKAVVESGEAAGGAGSLAQGKPKRTVKAPKPVYEPQDPRMTKKKRIALEQSENGAQPIEKKAKRGRKQKQDETTETSEEFKQEQQPENPTEKSETGGKPSESVEMKDTSAPTGMEQEKIETTMIETTPTETAATVPTEAMKSSEITSTTTVPIETTETKPTTDPTTKEPTVST